MRFKLLLFILFSCQIGLSQDTEAAFPGGTAALSEFVKGSFVYPHESVVERIEGVVKLSFIIEADGSVSTVKVEKSVGPLLDEEAVRIMENMPVWIPSKVEGVAVRTKCRLPITFHITKKLKKCARKQERKNKRNE